MPVKAKLTAITYFSAKAIVHSRSEACFLGINLMFKTVLEMLENPKSNREILKMATLGTLLFFSAFERLRGILMKFLP